MKNSHLLMLFDNISSNREMIRVWNLFFFFEFHTNWHITFCIYSKHLDMDSAHQFTEVEFGQSFSIAIVSHNKFCFFCVLLFRNI